MEINMNDIENHILQSNPHFQNITIRGKKFKKDIRTHSHNVVKDIYRLTMHYEKDGKNYEKSFFLAVPYNNPHYEKLRQLNIYSKERKLYTDLFPQYELLLPRDSLHADFFGTDGRDVLILEDLSLSGWRKSENQQLSLEQITKALEQLAKFHALSVKVNESQPEIVNDIKSIDVPPIFDWFSSIPDWKSWLAIKFREIVDLANPTFANEHSDVLLYFENYLKQMSENLFELDDKFNVLNHGSICTRDIWFAYNDLGEVTGVKFTNFQNCHWGNPITDIIFLVVTSTPFEIFEKNLDTLLKIYTKTLNETLEKLNCEPKLSVEELQASINSNYEYFVYFLVAMAVGCRKASDTGSDKVPLVEFMDEESYIQLAKQWMSYFIRKGKKWF